MVTLDAAKIIAEKFYSLKGEIPYLDGKNTLSFHTKTKYQHEFILKILDLKEKLILSVENEILNWLLKSKKLLNSL